MGRRSPRATVLTPSLGRQVDEATCHYLVDLDLPHQAEPHYVHNTDRWVVLASLPFLDAQNSKRTLFRAFWVPGYSEHHNSYAPYVLLANKQLLHESSLAAAATGGSDE